ncbi:hypothetical protein DTQ13_07670 [Parasaccharibacter sp. TMW 2.1888]|nr:hypothetical protein [Parasaccharibacter sp. TMW 2.1884]MCL1513118.1 hypothetical protein [Parasaccharibacter sp. TMW 2.1891]MPW00616.1 hypothetical protein [Bombella apis]MUG79197.1 hypothetical protein [Bombella sp. ESL0380]MUH02515.1 hypothetical protein [Bombella sp. ESL0387]QGT75897.1 hypothetical protein GN304_03405 [Bombella sp. ESL0368]UPO80162.1 hypothetical protein DTQ13_07670 [Parasaccharibacter sp. TMW 2.1888]
MEVEPHWAVKRRCDGKRPCKNCQSFYEE